MPRTADWPGVRLIDRSSDYPTVRPAVRPTVPTGPTVSTTRSSDRPPARPTTARAPDHSDRSASPPGRTTNRPPVRRPTARRPDAPTARPPDLTPLVRSPRRARPAGAGARGHRGMALGVTPRRVPPSFRARDASAPLWAERRRDALFATRGGGGGAAGWGVMGWVFMIHTCGLRPMSKLNTDANVCHIHARNLPRSHRA